MNELKQNAWISEEQRVNAIETLINEYGFDKVKSVNKTALNNLIYAMAGMFKNDAKANILKNQLF